MTKCTICGKNVAGSEDSADFGGLCSQECLDLAMELAYYVMMSMTGEELFDLAEQFDEPELRQHIRAVAEADLRDKQHGRD